MVASTTANSRWVGASRASTSVLEALGDDTIKSDHLDRSYQDDIDDDLSTFETYESIQYNENDELLTAHDGSNEPVTCKHINNLLKGLFW